MWLQTPFKGASQAVIESYRNLIILGAKPLAITNCLNFGNPEKPEIMGQIVKSIEGISAACKKLQFPVISGNVSLYNETNGKAIQPTPNIGSVGLIDNMDNIIKNYFTEIGQEIFVIGDNKGEMGSSLYLREVLNIEDGDCPDIDYDLELKHANFVTRLIKNNDIEVVNDISDGGLLTLLTKMSFINNLAFDLTAMEKKLHSIQYYFAEDQARYVIATKKISQITKLAKQENIPLTHIGTVISGDKIKLADIEINLANLKEKFMQVIS